MHFQLLLITQGDQIEGSALDEEFGDLDHSSGRGVDDEDAPGSGFGPDDEDEEDEDEDVGSGGCKIKSFDVVLFSLWFFKFSLFWLLSFSQVQNLPLAAFIFACVNHKQYFDVIIKGFVNNIISY